MHSLFRAAHSVWQAKVLCVTEILLDAQNQRHWFQCIMFQQCTTYQKKYLSVFFARRSLGIPNMQHGNPGTAKCCVNVKDQYDARTSSKLHFHNPKGAHVRPSEMGKKKHDQIFLTNKLQTVLWQIALKVFFCSQNDAEAVKQLFFIVNCLL